MVRVMVFTPTFGDGPAAETVRSVAGLRWDGEVVWEVGRHNPFPPPDLRNVFEQYRWAQERCLEGAFDGLLTVEHDMAIPPHALERMWDAVGEVVYGVYLFRHGVRIVNAFELTGGRNIGSSLSLYPRLLARAERLGEVEVSGAGFGCTLIRRSVLEQVPFRFEENSAPDIPFAVDCLAAGIRQVARFDVRCGHVEGESILMPGERIWGMTTVKVNSDVTVSLTGIGSVRLQAGSVREVPVEDVSDLVRAGYVSLVVNQTDTEKGELPDARAQREQGRKELQEQEQQPPGTEGELTPDPTVDGEGSGGGKERKAEHKKGRK